MKKFTHSVLFLILSLMFKVSFSQESKFYIHVADTDNIYTNYTLLDHSDLNSNPNAIPIINHRYNVGSEHVSYVNQKQGVWYSTVAKKWTIFNQNKSSFKENSAYNVLIPGPDMKSFIHTTTASNVKYDYTIIDDNSINNNPNSIILVNDNYSNKYNIHILGVSFHQATGKWRIYNLDGEDMPEGLKFSVVVAINGQANYGSLWHTATVSNITNNRTMITNPNLDNNPDAIIFVTQKYTTSLTNNVKHIGVYYSGGKWQIYNETNGSVNSDFDMTEGSVYNVIYFPNKQKAVKKEIQSTNLMKVFPNPATNDDFLNVTLDESLNANVKITLFNMAGQTVYSEEISDIGQDNMHRIKLEGIERGLYYLKAESDGKTGVQKVIVQ